MSPGTRILIAAALIAGAAMAIVAIPADASEGGIAFEAEFISDGAGGYYLTVELQQKSDQYLTVTVEAEGYSYEGDIPKGMTFLAFKAGSDTSGPVYTVTVAGGGLSGTDTADLSKASTNMLIRFADWDGTALGTTVVPEGQIPVYKWDTPTRAGYIFTGWDPALGPVHEFGRYTAQYSSDNKYSVSVGAVKNSTDVRVTVNMVQGDSFEDGQVTLNYTYTEQKLSFGKVRVITHTAALDTMDIEDVNKKYTSIKMDLSKSPNYSDISTVWAIYKTLDGGQTKSSTVIYQPTLS